MTQKETHDPWDDLEFFTRKGGKFGNPKITITNKQTILFNSAFFHSAKLKSNTSVRLAYSPKKKAIIFDFTEDPKAEGAFALVQRGFTAFTTCRSFFNSHDLDETKIAGHYIPQKERIPRIGEMWVIRLDDRKVKE